MSKLLSRKQYDKWLRKLPEGICTFCDFKKYQIILKEFDYWVWIANLAPYWYWHTMIVPKRHFVEFDEMTFRESGELPEVLAHTKAKFLQSKVTRNDGVRVEKFVYFWRLRINRFDPISGTTRPNHFHLHLAPDKDHLWDEILDNDAYTCDVVRKLASNDNQSINNNKDGTN